MHFDCQACGACCCNSKHNQRLRSQDYVEVLKDDRLWQDERELLKRLGRRNEEGVWHLRLVGDEERCVALDGDIGVGVGCEIYKLRPASCRLVESGDEECLRARRKLGLPVSPDADRERIRDL